MGMLAPCNSEGICTGWWNSRLVHNIITLGNYLIMSEEPIEILQESFLKIKRLEIDEAKAKGQEWGQDLIRAAPFVKVELSNSSINDVVGEGMSEYFKEQVLTQLKNVGPHEYFASLLENPGKDLVFRGFTKKSESKSGWFSYEQTMQNIRKYGFDKPTKSPTPVYPSWVGDLETALGFAGVHNGIRDGEVGFLLAYKGKDSITFDSWDYKEYGVRFKHDKMAGNPDLETWIGRLVGVIEIKFV